MFMCLGKQPLMKAMAPHSSILAWKIPWTEEAGRTERLHFSLFTFMHWRRQWQPTLQCSCLENPRDGGAWWAAVYGVTQSQTRLKQLSSSSSSSNTTQSAGYGSSMALPGDSAVVFANISWALAPSGRVISGVFGPLLGFLGLKSLFPI